MTTSSTTLGRRIANWGTNLLVTGVIVVAGLTIGQEMLQWWGKDDPTNGTADVAKKVLGPGALSDESRPHHLEFGDFPLRFTRVVVRGKRSTALEALRTSCRQVATDAHGSPVVAEQLPTEQQMLRDVERMKVVETEAEQWEMFQLELPLPMVTVVSVSPLTGTGDSQVAGAARRVLAWGLAFPRGEKQETATDTDDGHDETWSLFVCGASGAKGTTATGTAVLDNFPLPTGCRRTMSLASEEGAAIIAFRGDGTVASARTSFDAWALRAGWRSTGAWRTLDKSHHARFENERSALDLYLTLDSFETTKGLLMVTPQ